MNALGEFHCVRCHRQFWHNVCEVIDMNANTQPGSEQATFSRRMAAQIRMIEQYRWQQFFTTGRMPGRDEAAAEWISRFAADFPQSFSA